MFSTTPASGPGPWMTRMRIKGRINALDLIILAAFTGGGVAWYAASAHYDAIAGAGAHRPAGLSWARLIVHREAFRCSAYLLLAWTVAFAVMRLRASRPPLRELSSRAGTSAVLAALVIITCNLVEWAATLGAMNVLSRHERVRIVVPNSRLISDWRGALQLLLVDIRGLIGTGVVAVWLILAFGGQLRVRDGWLEAFGTFVGVGWVLLLFEQSIVNLVYMMCG